MREQRSDQAVNSCLQKSALPQLPLSNFLFLFSGSIYDSRTGYRYSADHGITFTQTPVALLSAFY